MSGVYGVNRDPNPPCLCNAGFNEVDGYCLTFRHECGTCDINGCTKCSDDLHRIMPTCNCEAGYYNLGT